MEHKQPSGMTETQVEIPQAPDRIQNLEKPIENQNKPVEPTASRNNPIQNLEKPIENQNKPVEPTASQNNPNISENIGDVTETILTFKCELCNLNETYDFFGKSPPWSTKIVLLENAYICKDPFTIPQKKQVLILGSKCSVCEIDVCVSPKCSLFFSKRFCKHCAFKNMTYFPTQIQMKINKNFAS
ncbi:cysteine-rich DPF motif domain-containing protein 1-like [Diaphorina citri]|uniref:Cysteine-rich DPF motif domain-containing protein 1 n=1 Tax=Diaphorina citri TaxID=121845 RepID=A0A3Q0IJ44_DIACI|nr:cysteine-rich DPF motif domain-containing protein 1-like [Diaphorina citri]